jgi:hypothetical protein
MRMSVDACIACDVTLVINHVALCTTCTPLVHRMYPPVRAANKKAGQQAAAAGARESLATPHGC